MDTSYQVELRDLQPQCAAAVSARVDLAGIPEFIRAALGETIAVLAEQHLDPSGPPFARYRVTEEGFDVEAGFPTVAAVAVSGRVEPPRGVRRPHYWRMRSWHVRAGIPVS